MANRTRLLLRQLILAVAGASLACSGAQVLAVTAGQVDDFDTSDSDTLGWGSGGQTQTSIAIDMGAAGVGDNALQLGFSNLSVVFNSGGEWFGDWTSAAISRITLDVMSPSTSTAELTLWLGIGSGFFGQGGSGNTYVSSTSQSAPSDGQWHSIGFDVAASDWTMSENNDGGDIVAALQSVDHFRILHNPTQSFLGVGGVDGFFIDNITAIGVPEPCALACLAPALLLASSARSRRRRAA